MKAAEGAAAPSRSPRLASDELARLLRRDVGPPPMGLSPRRGDGCIGVMCIDGGGLLRLTSCGTRATRVPVRNSPSKSVDCAATPPSIMGFGGSEVARERPLRPPNGDALRPPAPELTLALRPPGPELTRADTRAETRALARALGDSLAASAA